SGAPAHRPAMRPLRQIIHPRAAHPAILQPELPQRRASGTTREWRQSMILCEKLLMAPGLSPKEQQAFVRRHRRRCRHVVNAYILQISRGQEGWVAQAGNGARPVLYSVVERHHDPAAGLPADRWRWPTDILRPQAKAPGCAEWRGATEAAGAFVRPRP